jgi:hypothetical protein
MSESILFDTDIVIDFLRGNKLAVSHFKSLSDKICFSVILDTVYCCCGGFSLLQAHPAYGMYNNL